MELTDEEIDTTMRYIGGKMIEAQIDVGDPYQVIKFMILNPLPDHMEVIAELRVSEEAAKKRKIKLLHEELSKLEGE